MSSVSLRSKVAAMINRYFGNTTVQGNASKVYLSFSVASKYFAWLLQFDIRVGGQGMGVADKRKGE